MKFAPYLHRSNFQSIREGGIAPWLTQSAPMRGVGFDYKPRLRECALPVDLGVNVGPLF